MNDARSAARQRLRGAAAASLALHASAALLAGWRLPADDEPAAVAMIDARLAPAARRAAMPSHARPRPKAPEASGWTLAEPPPTPAGVAPLPAPLAAADDAALAALGPPPASSEAASSADAADRGAATAIAPAPLAMAAPQPAAPSAPTLDINWPIRGRIEYAISRGERGFVIGRSVQEWQHDDTHYRIDSVSATTGLAALLHSAAASLSSEGAMTASGLTPYEYRAQRGGRNDVATFDWTRGRLGMNGAAAGELPLSEGAQDLLSLFYQLGILWHNGVLAQVAVATGHKFEIYRFDNLGEERLELAFGAQRALHLRTQAAPGEDRTDIWLGVDLAGLPLQIRHADRDGGVYYQTAEKVELGGAATGATQAKN